MPSMLAAMPRVWISSVSVAHPPYLLSQEEAVRRVSEAGGDPRRVATLARSSRIQQRAVSLTPDEIVVLGSIEERNRRYHLLAPPLAIEAAADALTCRPATDVDFLAVSSCTGYIVPGLDVSVAQALAMRPTVSHLPITEAGCAAGVVGMARVADYLRSRENSVGLAVAAEVCSLAAQDYGDNGNLTSTFLFADGGGAALLHSGSPAPGDIEIVDSLSWLVPDSRAELGFELTDRGFYPVLSRELPDLLPGPTLMAVGELLGRNGLRCEDVPTWLVHPGGPRILQAVQETLRLGEDCLRWSWDSLAEYGNTSSAAIYDVLRRYRGDPAAPERWGVVIAFGPGVSLELLLIHR